MKPRCIVSGLLASLAVLGAGIALAGIPGDINEDGKVNVGDVQCVVLAALKPVTPACLKTPSLADINCDGKVNVGDVQLMVGIALKTPKPGLPPSKDTNGNNIVDACEAEPVCPNGKCEEGETSENCPADCPPTAVCPNGKCEEGETSENCPADCPPTAVCPNGKCEEGETCSSCEADCGACPSLQEGGVIITEIMKAPKAVDDSVGEWFEVRNLSAETIDLKGWTIEDEGGQSHKIALSVPIESGKMAVLAVNGDSKQNGGVIADYVYSDFTLGDISGTISLVGPDGTVIDEVSYDALWVGCPGRSISLTPSAFDHQQNDLADNWCLATTFIPQGAGDWGTPGFVNPACGPKGTCGNGMVEVSWEECDGGPNCTEKCCFQEPSSKCGNGKLEWPEQCDDGCLKGIPYVCEKGIDDPGGGDPTDTCRYDCTLAIGSICGNKIVEEGEECDDGGDSLCCTYDCKSKAVCGDGIINGLCGEECDDGNKESGDGCSELCKVEYTNKCGNGVLEEEFGEECDDGCMKGVPNVCEEGIDDPKDENDTDKCTYDCKIFFVSGAKCGNGVVEPGEECDDGCMKGEPNVCEDVDTPQLGDPTDNCTQYCKFPTCPCASCLPNTCGNGIKEGDEECDDCNLKDNDGCSSLCKLELAGEMGFQGMVYYTGAYTAADCVRVEAYSQPCPSFDKCPEGVTPEGGTNPPVKNPKFPQSYKVTNLKEPGTYYGICVLDIGCNNPMDLGSEDLGGLVNNGAPIVVGKGQVVPGANCTIEGGAGKDTGSVSGTVTYTKVPTANDTLLIMVSETYQPPSPVKSVKFKPPKFPQPYQITNVPVGSYYVLAIFDVGSNNDGKPPGPEDAFTAYKTKTNKVKVNITKDQDTPNINLDLSK